MSSSSDREIRETVVHVSTSTATLEGNLSMPAGASGVVLFAHGSGSSRRSPRNRYVAQVLQEGDLATLLVDLLTADEEAIDTLTAQLRFDMNLLSNRLIGAVDWLSNYPTTRNLGIGLFGASTGGGAALIAAAARPGQVEAVVSRGGRPDLAGPALPKVEAPTLLIVGGRDTQVIQMNRQAMTQIRGKKKLEIVPEASHLFEEPGALEEVARLAREWFQAHLGLARS